MTAAGTPAGAIRLYQVVASNPFTPCDPAVETSGSAGDFSVPVTAAAATRPALYWGSISTTWVTPMLSSPEATANSTGELPL
ncbi:hypothetical protein G6F22_021264 [Rhizopus arrhizus]|nr:hypothetical protein G6F22_021264 [Rhizopus arrhizus]KAG1079364.1 hypothetical protein G6F40_016340 [Rhizopus arrhizus]